MQEPPCLRVEMPRAVVDQARGIMLAACETVADRLALGCARRESIVAVIARKLARRHIDHAQHWTCRGLVPLL